MGTNIFKSNKSDEWYTERKDVELIAQYIPHKWRVWCPFDTAESNFVKVFKEKGYDVVYSHIKDGKDFFEYEPEHYDCIVSNPPFSKRNSVYQRLFSLGKPFAMIANINGCFDCKSRYDLFAHNRFELLIPKGRMRFISPIEGRKSAPPFQSIYICHDILKDKIVMSG